MALASKPSGSPTDAEKLAQLEEELKTYRAVYAHRHLLVNNDNLIVTRFSPGAEQFTYAYTTVSDLANTLTYEYLTRDTPVEKINERIMKLLNFRLRGSNRVKEYIKESELPEIQKLIDSTKNQIREIEASSQEPAVRIEYLRKEIELKNRYIERLDRHIKDKNFIFDWTFIGLEGAAMGGSKEEVSSTFVWQWFERKLHDPSFKTTLKGFWINLIAQNHVIKTFYREVILPENKRDIERYTNEIRALEAEMQREPGGRIDDKPSAVVPSPKPVFNGQWRMHYQGWYILEIQESQGKVSGEIWHAKDEKRGQGSLSGERLHNLVIGSASPQDGIRGEFEMVKEIQEYDHDARKYYPTLVQHDFKSFKFRIEDGNKLRGELCFRAKGGGESVCRAVSGEKVK
jgi:hypothetical protein